MNYRIYLNKYRPQISTESGTKKLISTAPPDALTADIFALIIMKLLGSFHRMNFSRNILDSLSV